MLTVVLSGTDFAASARKEDGVQARGLGTFGFDILTPNSPNNSPLLVNLKTFSKLNSPWTLFSIHLTRWWKMSLIMGFIYFFSQTMYRSDRLCWGRLWVGRAEIQELFILAENWVRREEQRREGSVQCTCPASSISVRAIIHCLVHTQSLEQTAAQADLFFRFSV